MKLALLSCLGGALAQTYGAVEANGACVSGVGCKGYYRAFVATTLPLGSMFGPPSNVTGISLAAIGAQASSDGSVTNARVDIAGFKFKTPADTSDSNKGLSFYFGYLGASGVWDNNTKTVNVAGALCEIASSLHSIQIFYDRDGVPGFQWDLAKGDDILSCASGTYDCVDTNGGINMDRLTWTPISRVVDKCVDKLPAGTTGYDATNCYIHTLSTEGQLNGSAVVSLAIRTASQPIKINGQLHTPDKAKWDLRIDYPWAIIGNLSNASAAHVALLKVHAGKAVSAAAVATVNEGTVSKALTFTANGGKQAYFGYTTSVTVDGAAANVITDTITNTEIKNWNGQGILTNLLMAGLKINVGILEAFYWIPQLTVHSFEKAHPNSIVWDPVVGVMTAPANVAIPSLVLVLLAFIF